MKADIRKRYMDWLAESAFWQAEVLTNRLIELGIPLDDGEDFLSLWGRVHQLVEENERLKKAYNDLLLKVQV